MCKGLTSHRIKVPKYFREICSADFQKIRYQGLVGRIMYNESFWIFHLVFVLPLKTEFTECKRTRSHLTNRGNYCTKMQLAKKQVTWNKSNKWIITEKYRKGKSKTCCKIILLNKVIILYHNLKLKKYMWIPQILHHCLRSFFFKNLAVRQH